MKKQQGSAHVVIIIVLVVVVLGALGFIFWQNFIEKKPVKDVTTTPKTEQQTTTPTKDSAAQPIQANWLAYTSQNNKYSVSIPDGWSLDDSSETDDLTDDLIAWTSDHLVYTPGTKATVSDPSSNKDEGSTVAFYLIYNYTENNKSYLSPDLKKVTSYTTANGVSVDKFRREQTNNDTGMGIPFGTIEYTYDLYKNGVRIHIIHDISPDQTNQTSIIENMISTLKFL